MNILVLGAHFVNKGAEAMLRTVQAELGRRIPGASFWVLQYPIHTAPRETELALRAGLRLAASKGLAGKFASLAVGVAARPRIRRAAFVSPVAAYTIKHMGKIDAVVDASGFVYGDTWGLAPAKRTLPVVQYCRETARPYVFLPQAWGPFSDARLVQCMKDVLQGASLICARDHQSYEHLLALVNKGSSKLVIGPDIAFRFKGDGPEVAARLLEDLGLVVGERPLVGIAPNMRVYERRAGTNLDNAYVKQVGQVVRFCTRELGADVVLIPHEIKYRQRGVADDRHLCRMVRDGQAGAGRVVALVDEYSAEAIKAVIGQMQLLVGSRYHSIVAALSCGVPAVVLGWSHKYAELMRLVGLERFAIDDIQLERGALTRMLAEAWEQREESRRVVQEHLPSIERDVDGGFDQVAAVLKGARRFS